MNLNVENFKKVLEKATLNFSIDSVQLSFTKDTVRSNMVSENRQAVTNINLPNDVLDMKSGSEYEFNFSQPSRQLIPFLNLIDEEADIKVFDEKIVITSGRQKSNIHFCSPDIVSVFSGRSRDNMSYFLELEMDETLQEAFDKIKKIANQFGNIYFNVESGNFNIETADRSNRYSNSLKFELIDGVDMEDISLRFPFENMRNLIKVINGDMENFKMLFSYVKSENMGLLLAKNTDDSENYFLMSMRMENEI
jgi:hypothetical protein